MLRFANRHLRDTDRHLAIGALTLCLLLTSTAASGCGESLAGNPEAGTRLIEGPAAFVLSSTETDGARRSALVFARSYVASVGQDTGLRDATPALEAELAANRVRRPDAGRMAPLRLLAVMLSPRSARRVEATASFAAGREAPFPIVFELRRSAGRWLVFRLLGN